MSIEAMKQALENELSASDFIDKAPQSWDKTERAEWARLQAMLHNIRVFRKAMRQAIAEAEKQEPVAYDVRCDNCGGDGYDPKDNNYFCSSCEGAGFLEKLFYTHPQSKETT